MDSSSSGSSSRTQEREEPGKIKKSTTYKKWVFLKRIFAFLYNKGNIYPLKTFVETCITKIKITHNSNTIDNQCYCFVIISFSLFSML